MKRFLLPFIALITLFSCTNNKKDKPAGDPNLPVSPSALDTTLVTDSSWGPVTSSAAYRDLQTFFGAENVKDERICGPECIDSLNVTKVYAGTPKEIIVHWKDSAYHKQIGMLQSYQEGHPYHTSNGLKWGSPMNDLLRLNGKKITFAGFGWDYGGNIISFNGGLLDSSGVHFRLDIKQTDDNSLMGDSEFDTDMPVAKKALDKIFIYELTLSFYKE